jgi:succinyl-CoA synthetase alpha subunit
MSILVNRDTRVICQGITGKVGEFHTRGCLEYGTRMVGGVTPGKGGEKVADLPVFDTVAEAVAATGANATWRGSCRWCGLPRAGSSAPIAPA